MCWARRNGGCESGVYGGLPLEVPGDAASHLCGLFHILDDVRVQAGVAKDLTTLLGVCPLQTHHNGHLSLLLQARRHDSLCYHPAVDDATEDVDENALDPRIRYKTTRVMFQIESEGGHHQEQYYGDNGDEALEANRCRDDQQKQRNQSVS